MGKRLGKIVWGIGVLGMVMSIQAQTEDALKTQENGFESSYEPDTTPPRLVSEGIAQSLALGGTAIPVISGIYLASNAPHSSDVSLKVGWALIGLGAFIGPSLGQYYAGSESQATLGILGRGIGFGLLAVGFGQVEKVFGCNLNSDGDGTNCGSSGISTPLIYGGLAVFLGSTIYSLADTHFAVQRHNGRVHLTDRIKLIPDVSYIPNQKPLMGANAILNF